MSWPFEMPPHWSWPQMRLLPDSSQWIFSADSALQFGRCRISSVPPALVLLLRHCNRFSKFRGHEGSFIAKAFAHWSAGFPEMRSDRQFWLCNCNVGFFVQRNSAGFLVNHNGCCIPGVNQGKRRIDTQCFFSACSERALFRRDSAPVRASVVTCISAVFFKSSSVCSAFSSMAAVFPG